MAYPSDLVRTKDWGTEVLTDADLEGQLDLIINWVMAALNESTGHKHDATENEGPKILTANINDSAGSQGDVFYSSGTALTRLAAGTSGQALITGGAAANPAWGGCSTIQQVNTITGAVATGTTTIPDDDTIPQNTEGDEYMTLAITPTSATTALKIEVVCHLANASTSGTLCAALFQDSTANALAASRNDGFDNDICTISFTHWMTSGTTSATTFKVRGGDGAGAGTTTFNGVGGARKLGGVLASSITISEIRV